MAKKIGISRPMVMDVLLPPFTESFYIEASDTLQQWHYDQTGQYMPDRAITPLTLRPMLSVFDPETHATYTPSFYSVRWYLLNTATGNYDTEITNTEEGDVDYVVRSNGDLTVKKNVNESSPVNILCRAIYVDPRNAGKTYEVKDKVQLQTNRDSTVTSPSIEINQEGTVLYNPFIDASSRFTFNATVRLGDKVIDTTAAGAKYRVKWYAIGNGETTEQLIDATDSPCAKFPCYVSGQGTPQLVVDAMLADQITIVARVQDVATNRLYPDKALRSLTWDNNIRADVTTEAIDGGAIKQDTASKTFRNIVTMRNRTLDASVVNANFLQTWKFRPASRTTGGSTPTDAVTTLGTGPQMELEGAKIHAQESSLVYSELELLGAYKVVKQGSAVVVQDGKVVICRF